MNQSVNNIRRKQPFIPLSVVSKSVAVDLDELEKQLVLQTIPERRRRFSPKRRSTKTIEQRSKRNADDKIEEYAEERQHYINVKSSNVKSNKQSDRSSQVSKRHADESELPKQSNDESYTQK